MKQRSIFDKKPTAIALSVAAGFALVVAMAVIVSVGVFLTGTRLTLAAIRRKSRRRILPPTPYMAPESHGAFNLRPINAKTGTGG